MLLFSVPALAPAQVIINKAALVQLAGLDVPAVAPVVTPAPLAHVLKHHHARQVVAEVMTKPVVVAPLAVVAKPVVPVVAKPVAPALPVAPGPLAIGFADGSAALPADAAAALKPFCTWHGVITVDAHAANDPNDPSGAMRLSLQRAFAVKQALTACGAAGSNVLPRADGAAAGAQTTTVGIEGPKT
jgi:hypothetical protein